MAEKLTTLNINVNDMMLKADKKKLRILAIANGEIQCSYQDAMKELKAYEKMVPQVQEGYLFLATAKYLMANRFADQNQNDLGTAR